MAKCQTISIYEVESSAEINQPGRACTIKIEVDGTCVQNLCMIQDPFQQDDVDKYNWYLEEWPIHESESTNLDDVYRNDQERKIRASKALEVREKLDEYGQKLHRQLDIEDLILQETTDLHINIWEPKRRSGGADFGIHQILWENLEQPSLWRKTRTLFHINVMVRRVVSEAHTASQPWETRSVTRESPLKVLLVVARKLTKTSKNRYTDIKSYLAQIHLLSVQSEMAPMWFSHQIELDIIRPGTYEALEKRLSGEKRGYFDLVHFDLHGDIEDNPRNAYLWFSSPNIKENSLERFSATDVAELLKLHGVKCVVTNACRSAVIYDRREANLSQIFIEKGVSHVSAMSHRICTTAVDIFYSAFYRALLSDALKFAEATSRGRTRLREDMVRKVKESHEPCTLRDWCVPVTYMCPSDQTCCKDHRQSWLRSTTMQRIFGLLRQYRRCLAHFLFKALWARKPNNPRSLMVDGDIATSFKCGGNKLSPWEFFTASDSGSKVPKAALPKVDINILDLERQLIHHGVLYIYGHRNNTATIQHLSPLWCRTNFIERAIHIRAKEYIREQNPPQYIVQWDKSNPWEAGPVKSSNVDYLALSSPNKKIAIVIEGIHDLYPEEKTLNAYELNSLQEGRERLTRYLTKHVPKKVSQADMYLIVTGDKDADWWESEDRLEVGGQPFLRPDPLSVYTRMSDIF